MVVSHASPSHASPSPPGARGAPWPPPAIGGPSPTLGGPPPTLGEQSPTGPPDPPPATPPSDVDESAAALWLGVLGAGLVAAAALIVGFAGRDTLGGSSPGGVRSPVASQMVAVLGSRGGCGTTTLAVNLAATLAAEPANGVALIDLDMALGDADISVETSGDAVISIADLARTIDRLDMNILKRALVKNEATGMAILRHPTDIADTGLVHEEHVSRILNLLRVSYSHLVVDLSKSLQAIDIQALRMADQVLLVAQLELASLRNVVRLVHYLSGEEGLADKVRVVINRVGAETIEEGISLKRAEESIGKPIFWQIPNDPKTVIAARVAGQPLVTHAPKSRAQQAYAGLAQAVSGRPAPGSNPDLKAKGGWLFGRR